MYREKRPGKIVSFPTNPQYLKDLEEGRVFRHDFAKARVTEMLDMHLSFAGFTDPEIEMYAEKITRCAGLRKDEIRAKSLDSVLRDELEKEARRLWEDETIPEKKEEPLSMNELMKFLGNETRKFSIRKHWVVHVPPGKTNEDVIAALKSGRYKIEETTARVDIRIDD